MDEKPLLFFPRPAVAEKSPRGGGGSSLRTPSPEEQRERLEQRFQEIIDSFHSAQETIEGAEPEMVVVFETAGDKVADLAEAAQQVEGLEWLAEIETDDIEAVHGFGDSDDPNKKVSCRLYAVVSNLSALERLVQLWKKWHENPEQQAQRNFGPFKTIFTHLLDVRPWSVNDRLRDTGLIEAWQEDLRHGSGAIRFEVELWTHASAQRQQEAYRRLESLLGQRGGRCISQCFVPEIAYHGVLAELPATSVRSLLEHLRTEEYAELLRFDEVMFFRPFGQARIPAAAADEQQGGTAEDSRAESRPNPALAPIVGVLDGLPLENHTLLAGRLVIDDPDDHSSVYEPGQQRHGTAMASLICHGDLNRAGEPLNRRIYMRPVLVPEERSDGGTDEVSPRDRLLVDLIHQAVRRMKEGDGEHPPVAPDVEVINLSLGNRHQPFIRNLSPLARLLDWLAWKYRLLFIVSAGNQPHNLVLASEASKWRALSEHELVVETLMALRDSQAHRRPLSPAEAVNAVTVGALHADDSDPVTTSYRVDLLAGSMLPSPICTVAAGFQRLVLPTILMPGGRQFYRPQFSAGSGRAEFEPETATILAPGLRVAAPGREPMELDRTIHTRGTSNAAAMATRCAARCHERLLSLRDEPGGDQLDSACPAVLLKTLLVHGASWGSAADAIEAAFEEGLLRELGGDLQRYSAAMLRLQTRFLGYGAVDPDRAMFCTDRRVTLLGFGSLEDDAAHVYKVPLPASLIGQQVRRRLIVTLGWLTPLNYRHRNYRRAQLWFDRPDTQGLCDERECSADAHTSRRGTVQHQIYDGERRIVYPQGATFNIKVNCAASAGELDEQVPYAVAVTLEIAEPVLIAIYNEVREEVHARIRPRG